MGTEVAVPEVIGALQLTTQALRRMAQVLPTWGDEQLVEFFRNCSELQNGTYYAQCLIAHILFERYTKALGNVQEARRAVGRALSVSPFTVYELVETWTEIFARLGVEDYALPRSFYGRALRGRRAGIDPVEAIRYAAHRRQVLGEGYRASDFDRDIRRGLPEPEPGQALASQAPSCRICQHLAAAPEGARLWLVLDGKADPPAPPVAWGDAAGLRYCPVVGRVGMDLVPYDETAAKCPNYARRG